MMTQLKLLLSTAVLTVVIWVYADQSTHRTVDAEVLVRLAAPNRADVLPVVAAPGVRVADDAARVRVKFSGPKSAIQRLAGEERLELTIPVPDTWTDSSHSLNLFDALNRSPGVLERGLHVDSTYPAAVEVFMDRWTTAKFTVQVDAGPLAASLSGPIDVQPRTVEGRLRHSQLEQLGTSEPVVVVPVQEFLADRQGRVGPKVVLLPRTIRDIPVEFTPPSVEFTATLTQRTTVRRLSPIALSVLANPDMMGQYRVIFADAGDRIQSVAVRIPAARAEALRAEAVTAFITVRREDAAVSSAASGGSAAAEGWLPREVQFVFPPGFEDVRIEGKAPTVRIRVVEIAAARPAGVAAEPSPR